MANFLTQSTIQESRTLWIGEIGFHYSSSKINFYFN